MSYADGRSASMGAALGAALARTSMMLVLLTTMVADSVIGQSGGRLPTVRVIATGGTIAGEQPEPGTLGRYDPKKTVNEIVAMVPHIAQYAHVEMEQFSNVPSPSIAPKDWLRLAQRINAALNEEPRLAGIVITHGTSRLEETAFFLNLTVRSDRPVVVVGAQRPPTGISPDGPINLLSAVRVAASPEARGKGVTVVMDDRIISAREAIKIFPRSGGFEGAEMGVLGTVSPQTVAFFYQPVRRHTSASEFDVTGLQELPHVGISYSYAGAQGMAEPDAKAMIVATTGMAPDEGRYYEALRRKGVWVATTFPSGMSDRFAAAEQRANAEPNSAATAASPTPLIVVRHLTPSKARILMMLALTRTQDARELQRIFDSY